MWHVGKLCMETLQENDRVLVFAARDKCRVLADQLAKMKFVDVNLGIELVEAREQFAYDALPNDKDGSFNIANASFQVPFHRWHASEERQAIEVAYKRGLVRIMRPSTLAAGVNMPARRLYSRLARRWNAKTGTEKSAANDRSRKELA